MKNGRAGLICSVLSLLFLAGLVIACGCVSPAPAPGTGTVPATSQPDVTVRIIIDEFPRSAADSPDGNISGVAADTVREILRRQNLNASVEVMPFERGFGRLMNGPVTAYCPAIRTDTLEHVFKWVGPVASYDYMLYTKNDTRTIWNGCLYETRKFGNIGVAHMDPRHEFLYRNGIDIDYLCPSDSECLRELMRGRIHQWVGSTASAGFLAETEGIDPTSFRAIYPVTTVHRYIAFSSDTPDNVIREWQDTLDTMKQDGTYDNIMKNHGISASALTEEPETEEKRAENALCAMITETNERFVPAIGTLQSIAASPGVQAGDWQQIRPGLVVFTGDKPDHRAWYALPDGAYYTPEDGLTSGSMKNKTWFPIASAGHAYAGTEVLSRSTGRIAGFVAMPVKSGSAITGILGVSINLDTLADTIRPEVPDNYVWYAIDTQGKFALSSDREQLGTDTALINSSSSFAQALGRIRSQERGSVEYDEGGVHYQARFRTSPRTGWQYVVAWPAATG